MSTKKQLRRDQRQQKEESAARRGLSPVSIFVLSIATTLLLVGVIGGLLASDREPPWPGASWSEAHGHWH